jgi:hypothetical protein
MTNEQQIVQAAVEALLRVASRYKVVVCGFAFAGDPEPMIVNFGNCNDAHKLALYEKLVEMCEEKRASGQAISAPVREIN